MNAPSKGSAEPASRSRFPRRSSILALDGPPYLLVLGVLQGDLRQPYGPLVVEKRRVYKVQVVEYAPSSLSNSSAVSPGSVSMPVVPPLVSSTAFAPP